MNMLQITKLDTNMEVTFPWLGPTALLEENKLPVTQVQDGFESPEGKSIGPHKKSTFFFGR